MTDVTPVEGTYDPQLLTLKDRVRSTVGDVGPEFLIPDVTYDAQLELESDWRLAAAAIADQLSGMFAKDPNSYTETGFFSAGFGDRAFSYRRLARDLRDAVRAEKGSSSTGYSSSLPTREDEQDAWEYTRPRL